MPFFTATDSQQTHQQIFGDISVVLKILSWLCLVVSPWSLLALVGEITNIAHLSVYELILAVGLLLGAIPQLVYCTK